MKQNTGNLDRVLRVVLGLVIMGAGWFMGSWLGLIGLIPLGTAAVGFCPLYSLIGVSTCSTKQA
ncbi:MAG: DUF2892 domain-containing protein [Leptospiraceae bacterium]|nr:DUF2892 domain-containing protein [Leptospiraceae bacterium]